MQIFSEPGYRLIGSLIYHQLFLKSIFPFLKIHLFDQDLWNAYSILGTTLKPSLDQRKENLQPKGIDYMELLETGNVF